MTSTVRTRSDLEFKCNGEVFIKVFNTSLFPNLFTDLIHLGVCNDLVEILMSKFYQLSACHMSVFVSER